MESNNVTSGLILLLILLLIGSYWALQPACHHDQVRVRGLFSTRCVVDAGRPQ